MQEFIVPYISFLSGDCRYSPNSVSNYVNTFRDLVEKLNIQNAYQIDASKVRQARRLDRWETTAHGIQAVEGRDGNYAQALRMFIEYLKDVGYPLSEGIDEAIKSVDSSSGELAGFSEQEVESLKRFLVFNIDNDIDRKNCALFFLLLSVPLSLEQVLNLRVGDDGKLPEEGVAGHFHCEKGNLTINFRGLLYPLPEEAATFVSFYLENRPQENNAVLFVRGGKGKLSGQPLTRNSARKALHEVCQTSGIQIKADLLETVINRTALERNNQDQPDNGNRITEREIEIVRGDSFSGQVFTQQPAA